MNAKSSYCFLINCASNSGRSEAYFRSREKYIKSAVTDPEFIYIRDEDSIKEIASRKSANFTHIVACGGDGTVNQVANGIMDTKTTLVVLPMGSGNDFAKSIGLKKSFAHNFGILLDNQITNVDVIRSEWGYFLNTFGIGVDGLTNYYSGISNFKSGKYRYFFSGLKALFSAAPFKVKINIPEFTRTIDQRVWMVAIANGNTEGGKYEISPGSVNNDGQVEIVVVKDVTRLSLFFEFIKLSLGYAFRKEVVKILSTSSGCGVKTEIKARAHADGEQVGYNTEYNFELLKGAIPVVVNTEFYA